MMLELIKSDWVSIIGTSKMVNLEELKNIFKNNSCYDDPIRRRLETFCIKWYDPNGRVWYYIEENDYITAHKEKIIETIIINEQKKMQKIQEKITKCKNWK